MRAGRITARYSWSTFVVKKKEGVWLIRMLLIAGM
jgi:hypothetical protein